MFYTNGTTYNGTPHVVDQVNPWTSDGDMEITGVDGEVGDVVLSSKDNAGGDTVLRRVRFADGIAAGIIPLISGHKYRWKRPRLTRCLIRLAQCPVSP